MILSTVVTTIAGIGVCTSSCIYGPDGVGTNVLFKSPSSVAIDTNGVMYVTDVETNTLNNVRKITPAGGMLMV